MSMWRILIHIKGSELEDIFLGDCAMMFPSHVVDDFAGLAGFFHLVEETGLNPGLNRPGRNRFLPPEVEKTGKKCEMHD